VRFEYESPADCVQAGQVMSCKTLKCDCDNDPGCEGASILVQTLAAGATGPNVFNCTTTAEEDASKYHSCVLEIPQFLVQRTPLNCTTGQCVDSAVLSQLGLDGGAAVLSNATLVTALDFNGARVNATLNACIAAIPTIVGVLLSGTILMYFWAHVSALYAASGPSDDDDDAGDDAHAASAAATTVTTVTAVAAKGGLPPSRDCLEFSVSAAARLSSHALARRLRGVRGTTRLSFPSASLHKGADVEIGSTEAQRSVAGLHLKSGQPNQWYILDTCAGKASSGSVTGILGPSGCGKTTLLSVMSGAAHASLKSLNVTGKVTWNGRPVHSTHGASIAFVPQMDALIPTMTVREQLLFAGRLKNPTMEADAVRAKAEGILRELGIDDIADQYVGGSSSIRGISGGEVGADIDRRARTPRLSH